jgi:hypothetical protein
MVALTIAAGQVFAGGHKALPSDAADQQVLRIATSSSGENSFIFTGLSGAVTIKIGSHFCGFHQCILMKIKNFNQEFSTNGNRILNLQNGASALIQEQNFQMVQSSLLKM